VVAPSWHETYGFTVLEAMAQGAAVIATDVDGHADLVDHGRTGWLVPPRSPGDLANAIAALLDDPEGARQLGDNAALVARRERAWPQLVDAWLEVYR
jgi:glycosyltransferase involved in cell wall biosynthesis